MKLGLFFKNLFGSPKWLGKWGEKKAEKFLLKNGLKSLARNFNCKTGEIDLVMADADGTLVFVEVKTRSDEDFTEAEEVITYSKKTRLARAARYFLTVNKISNRPYRFDTVIVIVPKKGKTQIRHYPNCFVPDYAVS
ncbi:MAG: YraN family protein [Phycisphaerae bacterium]|nr:YraN family protein [Phycisphaerae bacterium]